ncbi:CidA/LrgA family protein [Rhizobium puerariae]|uniref:CidA/LrgA family protein n=1 Tax=Rhizobium puerariae TaxID=1585791 RepID=A0ABV6AKD5_9HYPH
MSTVLRRAQPHIRESRIFQAVLISLFWLAGEAIVRASGLPLPGSVVGLFLVLALFSTGAVRTASMRRGAQWYIGDMLLFFIPAVLAVLDHREFLGLLGLKILAVILIGTLIVMLTTALAVELSLRLAIRVKARHEPA